MSKSVSFFRVSWMLLALAGASALPSFAEGPLHYYTLSPCRLVDTRNISAPIFSANSYRTFKVQGSDLCGVPTGAKAVLLNVTVTQVAGAAGHLTLYPTGIDKPGVSNINFIPSDTIANGATVVLADGANFPTNDLTVYASAGAHVILDVSGYFR